MICSNLTLTLADQVTTPKRSSTDLEKEIAVLTSSENILGFRYGLLVLYTLSEFNMNTDLITEL